MRIFRQHAFHALSENTMVIVDSSLASSLRNFKIMSYVLKHPVSSEHLKLRR